MDDTLRKIWAEATQRATWGCSPAIAKKLRLSSRAVEQWGDVHAGKRSPGERLEILMREALEHRPAHDALAPLHLMAQRFGFSLVPLSKEDPIVDIADINALAATALREACESVEVTLRAISDEKISRDEREDIHRECDEAIEALHKLKQVAGRHPVTPGIGMKNS